MSNLFGKGRRTLWLILALGIVVIFGVHHYFAPGYKPAAPEVAVFSSCKKLAPGMRRIGSQYGFQFDVPAQNFNISGGIQDAPPLERGFKLDLKNSASYMVIEQAEPTSPGGATVPPGLIDSDHAEKRRIVDDRADPVGEDTWGYRDGGERWRRVRFRGGVVARYGSVNAKDIPSYGSVREKEAEVFDQVINSVCFSSAPGT